jgi:hypothetical protein
MAISTRYKPLKAHRPSRNEQAPLISRKIACPRRPASPCRPGISVLRPLNPVQLPGLGRRPSASSTFGFPPRVVPALLFASHPSPALLQLNVIYKSGLGWAWLGSRFRRQAPSPAPREHKERTSAGSLSISPAQYGAAAAPDPSSTTSCICSAESFAGSSG